MAKKINKVVSRLGIFDKILNTIKKNWYLLVIGILGVVILGITYINGGKLSGLVDTLGKLASNYRKQVKTIDKLSGNKSDSDKKAIDENRKKLILLKSKEQKQLDKVEKEKQEAVDGLKKKKSKDLAKKMKDEFKI